MKIEVGMSADEDKFYAHAYWATSPEFVLKSITAHLEAAAVIWPDLGSYQVAQRTDKTRGGAKGGHARAAALSPERRKEVATTAAKARWNKPQDAA